MQGYSSRVKQLSRKVAEMKLFNRKQKSAKIVHSVKIGSKEYNEIMINHMRGKPEKLTLKEAIKRKIKSL